MNKTTGEFVVYDKWNSSLPENFVRAITIDNLGNKWIGTYSGGLAVYREGGVILNVKDNKNNSIPVNYSLSQNYPNPFNPETHITYQLPERSTVRLEIFNTLGQKVRTLVSGVRDTGIHTVVWNGRDDFGQPVASGVYLYKLEAGKFRQTKKMILMK